MTKTQWKAIYDYCEDNCYVNPYELLKELKEVGAVDRQTEVDEIGDYADDSYDGMIEFLTAVLE